MKRIGITQRVEHIESYDESRDCLDQRWSILLLELEYIPIPLANINPNKVPSLLDALSLDGIIFSGGNSIAILDKTASDISLERDAFEVALFREAVERKINIIGVCRGMQMLNIQFGGTLSKVQEHVAVKHKISSLSDKYTFSEQVNSYHNWGITQENLAKGLTPLAKDSDENIEAFVNEEKKTLGIMWHPERETPFDPNDIELIKRFL